MVELKHNDICRNEVFVRYPKYFVVLIGLLLCFLAIAGCKKEVLSSVSGKVTYNGKPFGAGSVNFYDPNTMMSGVAYMDENGNYEFVYPVPVGEYHVFVGGNRPLDPGVVDTRKMPKYPDKYKSYSTSGWTFTIVDGPNVKDFDMVD